ncbi:MAG: chloride channel protein [Bilifractor sp.]
MTNTDDTSFVTEQRKEKKKNTIWSLLFCLFAGAVTGAIVWGFLRICESGRELLWKVIPDAVSVPFYPVIICLAGGILIGIFQRRFGVYPEELGTVLGKIRKDHFYPYDHMPVLVVSALFPLILGASVGPEAGLTGIIAWLCYWMGSWRKRLMTDDKDFASMGVSAALGAVFLSPLFGLALPLEKRTDENQDLVIPKISVFITNILTVLAAFGVMLLFRSLFGGGGGMPSIEAPDITMRERLWGVPLALLGCVFGYFFLFCKNAAGRIFSAIEGKSHILRTALGGLALGIAGTLLPLTMFSGEEEISYLNGAYQTFAPWILILIGVVKLLLTNVCIESGLRGGHFFPVIFSGVSIGYGIALLTGLNPAFVLAVVTAALLGVTLRKPIAVTLLLLLCFPVRIIPWLIIAALIGSMMPGRKKTKAESEQLP